MKNIFNMLIKWCRGRKSEQTEANTTPKDPWFLVISIILANLTCFSSGISLSWTSPVIPKFKTDENPFDHEVTTTQLAWIAAFLPIGGLTCPFVAGLIADRLGRKRALIFLVVPLLSGFLILSFARVIELYYFARFLLGIGAGSSFATLPMYVAEITENHNRAKYGCLIGVFFTLGLFIPFTIGAFLTITQYGLCCCIAPLIFLIFFSILMPESPYYSIANGDLKSAENALIKLRNKKKEDVQAEILEITSAIQNETKGTLKDLLTAPAVKRALVIALGLVLLQEFSGLHPLLAYLKTIFKAGGETISPNLSTALFGCSQITSNFLTSLVIERVGRRFLYMVSSIGCCIAMVLLGLFFYLKQNDYDVEPIYWWPTVALIIYMVFFSMALGPLAWSIVGEIFPSNVKGLASAIIVCISFTASTVVTFTFPILSDAVGMYGCFWMYSIAIVIGMAFVYFVVPETRGKSMAEVQEILTKGKKPNNIV